MNKKIEILDTPPSQNEWNCMFWADRKRIKDIWEKMIWAELVNRIEIKKLKNIKICFCFPDNKLRDIDNIVYFKAILEGLKMAKIIPDDNSKIVQPQYSIKTNTQERRTIIEIEYE